MDHDLTSQIAEVIDDADENTLAAADVIIDLVTSFLDSSNKAFLGALTPAIELLSLEAEAARLRRTY